jgi:hypothetical protein
MESQSKGIVRVVAQKVEQAASNHRGVNLQ